MSAGDGVAGEGPPPVAVDATFRITLQDVFRAASEASRHTWIAAFAGFLLVFGAFFWAARDELLSLAIAVGGIGLSTGWLSGLIVMFNTRRRPDLLARDHVLHVDASGIRWVAPESTTDTAWGLYRRIREMRGDFLLDTGAGAATFVPKHGLTAAQTDTFRHLARQAGLLVSGGSWIRPVIGYATGAAACAVLYIGAVLILSST